MSKTLYATSAEAWRSMLHAIARARTSVYLEMYIFEDDTEKYDFVAALEAKARAGVQVVVILDAVGSFKLPQETRNRLIAAGVELMFYRYWFHRTHRKMLIVDERVAHVGGVNVGSRFSEWNDLVVRVRGPVVQSVVRSFARAYRVCGGTNPILMEHAQRTPIERARTWFVEQGLGGTRYVLRKIYEDYIDSAEREVLLVTPYFVPYKWFTAALARARKRGVQVVVLLPHRSDVPLVSRLNWYYAAMLGQLGATFYFSETMNHAKAMLVDDRVGVVGSQNIDALSFARNVESGIFFEEPAKVRELRAIVDGWRASATEYHDMQFSERWYDRVLVWVLHLAQPML